VLRVSRTIADLEESSAVSVRHVAEALRYRPTGKEHEADARHREPSETKETIHQ
jgi:magnesium chelatase subunit ChlI-like protein